MFPYLALTPVNAGFLSSGVAIFSLFEIPLYGAIMGMIWCRRKFWPIGVIAVCAHLAVAFIALVIHSR